MYELIVSGHVAEKEEEFEETLWRWQEFQSEMDACFRNLIMIEKSLDFQTVDDGELEDRRETHLVRFIWTQGGWGGRLPIMAYTSRDSPKGIPFSGIWYMKGYGFYSWKYMNG